MNEANESRLLVLRLRDRDIDLQAGIGRVTADAASRGAINSSGTIRALHALMETELSHSAVVIVDSLFEESSPSKRLPRSDLISTEVEAALRERKKQLEARIRESSQRSMGQNQAMVAAFMNLDRKFPLIIAESKALVELKIEELKIQRGKTKLARFRFWAENNIVIAGLILSFLALGAIKGAIDLLILAFNFFLM